MGRFVATRQKAATAPNIQRLPTTSATTPPIHGPTNMPAAYTEWKAEEGQKRGGKRRLFRRGHGQGADCGSQETAKERPLPPAGRVHDDAQRRAQDGLPQAEHRKHHADLGEAGGLQLHVRGKGRDIDEEGGPVQERGRRKEADAGSIRGRVLLLGLLRLVLVDHVHHLGSACGRHDPVAQLLVSRQARDAGEGAHVPLE